MKRERLMDGEDHRHVCPRCKGFTSCYKPKAASAEQRKRYYEFCSSPELFICQRCLERENFRRFAEEKSIKGENENYG